jgi:uncharacterized protein
MQLLNTGDVIISASDLTAAADCEWSWVRLLDKTLGYEIDVPKKGDAMMKRAGELGDVHEQKQLQRFHDEGFRVVEIENPRDADQALPWHERMDAATSATLAALRDQADVVFQAAFFDGAFQGFADFLKLTDAGEYEVIDTKLARKAKITALMQLAAYVQQLELNDIPVAKTVRLFLGDGSESVHHVDDIMPVFLKRRERLLQVVADRVTAYNAGGEAVGWNDAYYSACGRCEVCEVQVPLHDDLLQVAGMRHTQRAKLMLAGVDTMARLAAHDGSSVDGLPDRTLKTLVAQAHAQVLTRESSTPGIPVVVPNNIDALQHLPNPSAGDIFFDFEGDPLYQEGDIWNLDYLFGLVDDKEEFTAFWAHNLREERAALEEFLAFVKARRHAHPDMHIYHYAPYEKTHLLSLAARHGVGEAFVDELVSEGVLVDLYPMVKQAFRVGSGSYSLKKLEPLYMDDKKRQGVSNAADSVQEYADYCELRDAGEREKAAAKLKDIEQYNAYDCASTLALRNWLLGHAAEHGVQIGQVAEKKEGDEDQPVDELTFDLLDIIQDIPRDQRTPDQQAIALVATALEFHRRENKAFWWAHFARLQQPIEEWENTRDVYVIDSITRESDWVESPRKTNYYRTLLLHTTPAPGSKISEGSQVFAIYPAGTSGLSESGNPGDCRTATVTVLEVIDDSTIRVQESLRKIDLENDAMSTDDFMAQPLALTPGSPPKTDKLKAAIHEVGEAVLNDWPEATPNPAIDILRRTAPRGSQLTLATPNHADRAIVDGLLGMHDSYIAVQGPPGSGKTYTGSRVIAELIQKHGWRVGVVAQSHATVENMLAALVKAGVDPDRLAKAPKSTQTAAEAAATTQWHTLKEAKAHQFVSERQGVVFGGTAWTFTNEKYFDRDTFDLLVIDEAGQFSLANTIACSVAAKRLLLLGDPQQLPQVSQGVHPEAVDTSALGWLIGDEDVLPNNFGYFLDTSWRMNPHVCAVISELSYDGQLHSQGNDRHLEGVAPGFYPMPVAHHNNATSSPEEAEAIVTLVTDLLNRTWVETVDGVEQRIPLRDVDENIIVVAPYNAQVKLIRDQLDAAGYASIPVGTVDKFQGQEAAVAIVSLAASSAEDVPRGIEFLLMRNRLNVAISRAKSAAYLFYSPALTEFLPSNVRDLALLSGFIRLVEPKRTSPKTNSGSLLRIELQ